MNLSKGIARVVLTSFAVSLAWTGLQAAETPGKVQLIKATGNVTATRTSDHKTAPAKTGDIVQQGSAISTGKNSTAVLLFANGSVITLNPESTFAVDTFQQDPFDPANTNYKNLDAEPSKSKTKVTLSKGEIVGDMRKLNKGSTWDFNTPLGVAGIRGTKVFIKITKDSKGNVMVHISAAEGVVEVTSRTGQTYRVGQGDEVTLSYNEAKPDDVRGSTSKLTPEQIADIQQTADQSVDVIPGQPFTPPASDNSPVSGISTGDQGVGSLGTQIGGSGGGGGNGGSTPTPTPTPNPTATPSVNPTPGS